MAGPISFASDGPRDTKKPTEYGGSAGLVELGSGAGPNGVFKHAPDLLTPSEQRGILVRAQPAKKFGSKYPDQPDIYEYDPSGDAVDPVTGLPVDPAWNANGSAGGAVKAPPPTQNP